MHETSYAPCAYVAAPTEVFLNISTGRWGLLIWVCTRNGNQMIRCRTGVCSTTIRKASQWRRLGLRWNFDNFLELFWSWSSATLRPWWSSSWKWSRVGGIAGRWPLRSWTSLRSALKSEIRQRRWFIPAIRRLSFVHVENLFYRNSATCNSFHFYVIDSCVCRYPLHLTSLCMQMYSKTF